MADGLVELPSSDGDDGRVWRRQQLDGLYNGLYISLGRGLAGLSDRLDGKQTYN